MHMQRNTAADDRSTATKNHTVAPEDTGVELLDQPDSDIIEAGDEGEIMTDGGELSREAFDDEVIEHLDANGRPRVARMARDFASNSRAMGPSDVAQEENLARTEENVPEVAEAHIYWHDEMGEWNGSDDPGEQEAV